MNAVGTSIRNGVCLAVLASMVALSIAPTAMAQTRPADAASGDSSPFIVHTGIYDDQVVSRPTSGGPPSPTTSASPSTSPGAASFQRIWLALALVIGIIVALQWLSRRFLGGTGMPGSLKAVRILGRAPVSPKQQLVLIQIGRRLVLAANSGTQMNTLCELSDPDEVAALLGQLRQEKGEAPGAFAGLFKRANKEFEPSADEKRLETASSAPLPPVVQDAALSTTISATQEQLSGLMEKIRRMSARP